MKGGERKCDTKKSLQMINYSILLKCCNVILWQVRTEQTLGLCQTVHIAIRGCQLNSSHKCFPLIIYIRAGRWTLLLAKSFPLCVSFSSCLCWSQVAWWLHTAQRTGSPITQWRVAAVFTQWHWKVSRYEHILFQGRFVFLSFVFLIKLIIKSEKVSSTRKCIGSNFYIFLHLYGKKWWMVTLFYPSVVLENSIIFFFDSLINPYKGKLLMNLFIDHSFT